MDSIYTYVYIITNIYIYTNIYVPHLQEEKEEKEEAAGFEEVAATDSDLSSLDSEGVNTLVA